MLKQSAKVGWECAYNSGADRAFLLTGRADRRCMLMQAAAGGGGLGVCHPKYVLRLFP